MRYAFENVAPERSRVMSAIRKRGNRSTELAFRLDLVRAGLKGWEMHARHVPGCPDFLFPRKRVAVFVDGCFWHGCPKCFRLPVGNRDYWSEKITSNRRRDRRNTRILKANGWRVVRIWEHVLKSDSGRLRALRELMAALSSQTSTR